MNRGFMKFKNYIHILAMLSLLSSITLGLPISVKATQTTNLPSSAVLSTPTSSPQTTIAAQGQPTENPAEHLEVTNEGIIDSDDQFPVPDVSKTPYRQIVQLNALHEDGYRYVGSGAMIAPNLILTAAHNVYDRKTGKWATYVKATPTPSRNGGDRLPYGSYDAENYVIFDEYRTQSQELSEYQYDMAVIRLNQAVDSRVGELRIAKTSTVGQHIQIPGYPLESPQKFGVMYTMFGDIESIDNKLLRYQIDTEGGQSGSPVLNEQGEIIGVHIAGFSNGSTYVYNGARRVDDDTDALIVALHTGKEVEGVASYKPLAPRTTPTTTAMTTELTTKVTTTSKLQTEPSTTQSMTSVTTIRGTKVPTTTTKPTTSSQSSTPQTTSRLTNVVTTVTSSASKSTTLSISKTTSTTQLPTTTKLSTQVATKRPSKATTKLGTVVTTKPISRTTSKVATKSTTKKTTTTVVRPSVKTEMVYRLYHSGIKRHLYTKSSYEAKVLSGRGWRFEGEKFQTATKGIPVYRLYHSGTREHLYTTSINERDTLKTRGWRYEGIAWYSTGKKPIYRLYHAGLKVHLYTADANEKNVLSKRGWRYEGVAFNVQ